MLPLHSVTHFSAFYLRASKKLLCCLPKYLVAILAMIGFQNISIAQVDWTPSTKNGVIQMSGSTTVDYDIDILRSKANAGLRVFNSDAAGRAILLFGEGVGGRYGYVAYHNQTHAAGANYNAIFPARSTALVGTDINGLSLVSQGEMRFTSGGALNHHLRMVLSPSGNLAIGNGSSLAKLSVHGTVYSNATRSNTIFTGNLTTDNSNFVGSEGYWALRTAWDNSYNLDVYNNNSRKTAMTILQNGRIGIGTGSPDATLTVKGDIHTREVRVDLTGPISIPDYVFQDDYILMPLSEVEAYIKTHKHLPEVPSAVQFQEDGMKLAEMNLLLLKRIEELTLYLIDLKKENLKLNDELSDVDNLKREIAEIKSLLSQRK